jgi:hypothetical protein
MPNLALLQSSHTADHTLQNHPQLLIIKPPLRAAPFCNLIREGASGILPQGVQLIVVGAEMVVLALLDH